MQRISLSLAALAGIALACTTVEVPHVWQKNLRSTVPLFAFQKDGNVGFINASGRVVIRPTFDVPLSDVGDFSDGLARIGSIGYIDRTGRWAIRMPGAFQDLADFSDGVAMATMRDEATGTWTPVFIDTRGRVVGKVPEGEVSDFSEGLARLTEGGTSEPMSDGRQILVYPGKQGFIDRTGATVILPTFADAGPFVNGLARASLDGLCYVTLSEGGGFESRPSPMGGGIANDANCYRPRPQRNATSPCLTGFIGRDGKFMIAARYQGAGDFSEGLAAVRVGELWGFIDAKGSMLIRPQFTAARPFHEGVAAVSNLDQEWGYVDVRGRLVIPYRYTSAASFSGSLARVTLKNDHREVFIDRQGSVRFFGGRFRSGSAVLGLWPALDQSGVTYRDRNGKAVFSYKLQ